MNRNERCEIKVLLKEVPGISLGLLVPTHPDVMAAFDANDTFQKTEAAGRHIRTKIVTLKDRIEPGQHVRSTQFRPRAKMNQSMSLIRETVLWRLAPGKEFEA
jgi:hypothetical protein